jgi:hypothetical protein
VEPVRNKKLERKIEMTFTRLHERMHKVLSSYSDNELTFLLDAMTELVKQTSEESKDYEVQTIKDLEREKIRL